MYKRIYLILIIFLITLSIYSEPYKPKPILFIHGVGSNSRAWDAPSFQSDTIYINGHLRKNFFTDSLLKDSIIADSIELSNILQDTTTATGDSLTGLLNLKAYGTGTYVHFWRKMEPIVNEWKYYQDSLGIQNGLFTPYIDTLDNGWPNKTFLEVISFDDAWGSVDPHGGFPDRYNTPSNFTGGGDELKYRIREVLGEYYGTGPNDVTGEGTWLNDTTAKVILIAHSMGNQAVQEALMQDTILAHHLYKYITVDGVVDGTVLATPGSGDLLIANLYNHPVILPFKTILGLLSASINVATIMSKIDNNYSSNLPGSGIERFLFETSSELYYLVGIKYVSILYAMPFGFSIIRTNANQQLPVLRDLAKNSACVNRHKGVVAERIANAGGKFVSIRGVHPLYDIGNFSVLGMHNLGDVVFVTGNSLLATYTCCQIWPWVCLGGVSMLAWWWYDTNFDLLVDKWGQDLNSVNSEYNARVIDKSPVFHSTSPHNTETILKAIEDPPIVYIDSAAFAIKDTLGNIIGYEYRKFKENGIDTFPGKPSKIYGRIDEYFLANTQNTFAFNGQSEYGGAISFGRDSITGNELGLDGNKFVIDNINSDWLFTGVNKISVYSKNMLDKYYETV